MKWRLAIGFGSFVLFGIAASLPSDVTARFAIGGLAACSLVAAMMPDYALAFFRRDWRSLLRLLISLAMMAAGLIGTSHHLPRGWQASTGMAGRELLFATPSSSLTWVGF